MPIGILIAALAALLGTGFGHGQVSSSNAPITSSYTGGGPPK